MTTASQSVDIAAPLEATSREQMLHLLYEAAELEHCLMCTYLYAAYSLRSDFSDVLNVTQLAATRRWRGVIMQVAIDEMAHLAAVWNITASLGGAPRIGRQNLPLDPGYLPANCVVKLAPFELATLQHFIYLERPSGSLEPDGDGFIAERQFVRGSKAPRVTPMAVDYATVGEFYEAIGNGLKALVAQHGEPATFCGDPLLQMTTGESGLPGLQRVVCLRSALAALEMIVEQGEGAREAGADSHFRRFCAIRDELRSEMELDPEFRPAFPVATNPVLRVPPRSAGRVRIEHPIAVEVVDVANSVYGLMLRLLAHVYVIPSDGAVKPKLTSLAVGLMRAFTLLSEHAATLPVAIGATKNAGVTFIALRDSAAFPAGGATLQIFCERLEQIAAAVVRIDVTGPRRVNEAAELLKELALQARSAFGVGDVTEARTGRGDLLETSDQGTEPIDDSRSHETEASAIEEVPGERLSILFNGDRCIHARHCVTGAPRVFLANVQGPWIHPDEMDADRLVEIAHACPSGAIRYLRHDGKPQEEPAPINLVIIRESGPYAMRGDLILNDVPCGYRLTLCRCGASSRKPYCDGSHRRIGFVASGEPESTSITDIPAERDGKLAISPQHNGPLHIAGHMEIVSGTGRVIARVESAKLCRCGASKSKPFCDGSHVGVGFQS